MLDFEEYILKWLLKKSGIFQLKYWKAQKLGNFFKKNPRGPFDQILNRYLKGYSEGIPDLKSNIFKKKFRGPTDQDL